MIRYSITVAVAFAATLLAMVPALAQTATPSPTPTPFPGFSAKGTLAIEAQVSGSPIKLGAEVAVMTSMRRVRIDLLRLDMAGNDPSKNAAVGQFLSQGAITLVYDQSSRSMTIWSEQKRVYYRMEMASAPQPKARPSTQPTATPAPKTTPSSPIDHFLRATKSITEYDVLNQSLALVGHQPINGHTSTMLHFTLQRQKHGGKLLDVSGDLALADDLSGIPVRLWLAAKGDYEGSLKLDLVSTSTTPPDASVFAVPAGYQKVDEIRQIFAPAPISK